MRFVLATGNRHKLGEFRAILTPHAVAAMPGGVELPPEGVESFAANALGKARALAAALAADEATTADDVYVIADDSGLEVAALDGAPGVISSRYGGREGDDVANNARLLAELERLPSADARRARFVCVIACVPPDGREFTVRGEWPGTIAAAPRGAAGFGYDPLVVPDGDTRTVAELDDDEKNRESHRARAGRALLERLGREEHVRSASEARP